MRPQLRLLRQALPQLPERRRLLLQGRQLQLQRQEQRQEQQQERHQQPRRLPVCRSRP